MNSGDPVLLQLIYTGTLVAFVPWTVMVTVATVSGVTTTTTTIWVWRVEATRVLRITYVWPESPSSTTLTGVQNGTYNFNLRIFVYSIRFNKPSWNWNVFVRQCEWEIC